MPIVWGADPPQRQLAAGVRLMCVKARQSVLVCVLGPLEGLQTHWTPYGTKPCMGDEGSCLWHDSPRTWKGYVAVLEVYDLGGGQIKRGIHPAVLVCSEEIGWTMKKTKRGDVMKISRPGSKSNGPMRVESVNLAITGRLPEAFNVKPYVGRAMGVSLA